jgi:hypothetical protein
VGFAGFAAQTGLLPKKGRERADKYFSLQTFEFPKS